MHMQLYYSHRFASGYGYYAISFGVDSLSGDLYLNMFLLSIVEIPAQVFSWFLNNKYVDINIYFTGVFLHNDASK